MLPAALSSGLELVGGLVDCAVDVARRLGQRLPEPIRPRAVESRSDERREEPPVRAVVDAREQVEEAKYYLGPIPAGTARYADREEGELPRSYGRDRIVLLPRDPWWAFAYWEITPQSRIQALRALGDEGEGAREILRVYDVTFLTFTGDNAWLSFDVDLPPGADHWYLNVGRPAASFCVEIGLRTTAGRFLPLARSGVMTTPRSGPSPDTTVRWVDIGAGPGGAAETVAPAPSRGPGAWSDGGDAGSTPGDRPRSSDVHAPPPR